MPGVGYFCRTPSLRSGQGLGGRRGFEEFDRGVLQLGGSGVVAMTEG